MAEEVKKTRNRLTDEQKYAALLAEAQQIKARIDARKDKDYKPICDNFGRLLVQMASFDFGTLNSDQKTACKKDSPTAKKIVRELAAKIAAEAASKAEPEPEQAE